MKTIRVVITMALSICCAPVLAQSFLPGLPTPPCYTPLFPNTSIDSVPQADCRADYGTDYDAPGDYDSCQPGRWSLVFGPDYHPAYESDNYVPLFDRPAPQYTPPTTYLNTDGGSASQFQPWATAPVYPDPQQALRDVQNADPQQFLRDARGW